MKERLKAFLKKSTMYVMLFTASAAAAFFACSFGKKNGPNNQGGNGGDNSSIGGGEEETPIQKLMANIMETENFKLNMQMSLTSADFSNYTMEMKEAKGSLTNLNSENEDEKGVNIEGNMLMDIKGLRANTWLGFYGKDLYMDLGENHFHLTTDKFLSFVDALPSLNVDVEMPDEIKNLDLNSLLDKLNGLEPQEYENGDKFFLVDLGQNDVGDPILLKVKTDSDYKFKGITTDGNGIVYKSNFFKLNCDFEQVENVTFSNPKGTDAASKYMEFSPAFDVFTGFIKTFEKKQNRVSFNLDMNQKDQDGNVTDFIKADLNFDYSVDEKLFGVSGLVNEETKFNKDYKNDTYETESRKHKFNVLLNDKTMYVDYNKVKISLNYQTPTSIVDYITARIGDDTFNKVIEKITEMTKDIEMPKLPENYDSLNHLIKDVVITSDGISFKIDPNAFGLQAEMISFNCVGNAEQFDNISLVNLEINNYIINLTLKAENYSPVSIDATQYAQMDIPAFCITDTAYKLFNRRTFRTELSGSVKKESDTAAVTFDGGLQFDIDNKFGYGDISIIDLDNYTHKIEADFDNNRTNQEVLFAYNKELRGKMSNSSVTDIMGLIQDIVGNPDDHFMELFGELITMLGDSPLSDALKGDYGALFVGDIISNIQTDNSKMSMDVSTAIVGLEGTFQLVINYDLNEVEEVGSVFHSLEINHFKVQGMDISMKIELKDFDDSLSSSRLDIAASYFDFSDIKVLLALGINTSKFNYYEFTGDASVGIGSWDAINFNFTAKVRNDKGNVRFSLDIPDMPLVTFVNKETHWEGAVGYTPKNREVHIYYSDNMIHLYRHDKMSSTLVWRSAESIYTGNYEVNYFFENAVMILCRDALGLTESICNQITNTSSSGSGESQQIRYEKLLTSFGYIHTTENNKEVNYFQFGINIAELAHNNQLKSLTVRAYKNQNSETLESLFVNMSAQFGLTFNISFRAALTSNCSIEINDANQITAIDTYLAKYGNQEKNKTISKFNRLD